MKYQIDHLSQHPQHIQFVAEKIYKEFWEGRSSGYTQADLARLLGFASSQDKIPLSLIALVEGIPAGTINLIDNDDSKRTHLHPWLAALVVFHPYRRSGLGSALVTKLLEEAGRLGFQEVYLGADIPKFYARFGATVVEQANETLMIMRCPTKSITETKSEKPKNG